jgi:deazaflavin-dependent oxidoreductase (nitroreductase family)
MIATRQKFERDLFRTLNRFVEPAVRKGILSPKCAPVGLILLETIGFKSGVVRSTPLLATHVGNYTIVSTVRGKQSFWIRNLQEQPDISFYKGGRLKKASSVVITSETDPQALDSLPWAIAAITNALLGDGAQGLALAVLRTTG